MYNINISYQSWGVVALLSDVILNSIDLKSMKCAFFIKDLKTGETASCNENIRIPSASLIKIPIMMEIMQQVKSGRLSLGERIRINDSSKVPFSIVTMLHGVESYSIDDIMALMIVQSDNTAANVLMDLAGMDSINDYIKCLNLKNTILQRKMMDSRARIEGRENYTSAGDMAVLLETLYRGQAIGNGCCSHMLNIMKNQLDTGSMMLGLPYETAAAHKTGSLEFIEHDAGIVYLNNTDYIFCMLTWDAQDNNAARRAIGKASEAAYLYFSNIDI